MELAFRSVSDSSSHSGREFKPGDRVWSVLYRNAEGSLERADVLQEERGELMVQGEILCQWGQRIREPEASAAEERRAALQTREEIFLSLYEAQEDGEKESPTLQETRERMKFFLSLELERKRVLRPLGGGRYRHMPSKREYAVPQLELTPELVASHLTAEGLLAPSDDPPESGPAEGPDQ